MTATLIPDLSITLNQRRWVCVLDPTLALSNYGLPLVKQLGGLMELWIVRELWHILDNPRFYLNQPELVSNRSDSNLAVQPQRPSPQMIQSLKEWERLRTMTDRNSWNVHFLADVMGESCVPAGIDNDIIWRWESLAQSLDARFDPQITKPDTLTLAYRDLAALAAARPACILTQHSDGQPPVICQTLEQWGIPCEQVEASDAIVDIEREQFRNLLVHAGLSKFVWAGVNLAVVHLVVPAAAAINATPQWEDELSFAPLDETGVLAPIATDSLWNEARGFWYVVQ
jgi:hypothetical protein